MKNIRTKILAFAIVIILGLSSLPSVCLQDIYAESSQPSVADDSSKEDVKDETDGEDKDNDVEKNDEDATSDKATDDVEKVPSTSNKNDDSSDTSGDTKTECTCGASGDIHKEGCPLYESTDSDTLKASSDNETSTESNSEDEEEDSTEIVTSEIYTPTVNFTNVALFKDPVVGATTKRRLLSKSLKSSNSSSSTMVSQGGVNVDKTVVDNGDGTYDITLEAFATGSTITTEITEEIPTDIVLVLDQSGSMTNRMQTVSYEAYSFNYYSYSNSDFYNYRHNGGSENLWYKVGDSYYSVSVTLSENVSYSVFSQSTTNNNLYNNRSNLYVKINNQYVQVTVTRSVPSNNRSYSYTVNNSVIATSSRNNTIVTLSGTDDNLFYTLSSTNSYIYQYTDADGNVQTIQESTGQNTNPGVTFYYRYTSNNGPTRLAALQTALNSFVSSINTKAAGADGELGTDDDVNHRVAMVGFASGSSYFSDYSYYNTELFIGANQYTYGSNATAQYGNAFQDMNTSAGQSNVNASINALTANGQTYTNLGLEMANGIITNNPVSSGEKRNQVVVVFTDGTPGDGTLNYFDTVANLAYPVATTLKNAGVTVYTVGVFDGADATSAGSASGNDLTQKANYFMQNISSNNGTVQDPSYYLSASDADSLNNIFQQIANQVQSGGSTSQLTEEAVVKDIIAPQFQFPEGTSADNITLETYTYLGGEYTDSSSWSKDSSTDSGITASVSSTDASHASTTNNVIDVTGFDFSENYVGYDKTTSGGVTTETPRGKKLVIKIHVQARPGFLGGNNVATNTDAAIYAKAGDTTEIIKFPQPTVDVKLATVSVEAKDINTYLGQDLTALPYAHSKNATIVVTAPDGTKLTLKPEEENNGLESWQTAYVTVDITTNQNELDTFATDDIHAYTVKATLTNNGDTSDTTTDSDSAYVRVYKPTITYQDTHVFYGGDAPDSYAANEVKGVTWAHNGTAASDMQGDEPTLAREYNLVNTTDVLDGKINTKQDIPVNVAVKINDKDVTDYVTFNHNDCTSDEDLKNGKFLLHVDTGTLTITKAGNVDSDPFVFKIKKDGVDYTEISITGAGSTTINELPAGTYTIEEDTGWSWRYGSPSYSNPNSVTLSADAPTGTLTCTNTKSNDSWLNEFSTTVKNIFGKAAAN